MTRVLVGRLAEFRTFRLVVVVYVPCPFVQERFVTLNGFVTVREATVALTMVAFANEAVLAFTVEPEAVAKPNQLEEVPLLNDNELTMLFVNEPFVEKKFVEVALVMVVPWRLEVPVTVKSVTAKLFATVRVWNELVAVLNEIHDEFSAL